MTPNTQNKYYTRNCQSNNLLSSKRRVFFPHTRGGKREVGIGIGWVSRRRVMALMMNNPKSQNVKAFVTIHQTGGGLLTNLVRESVERIQEFVGKTLVLELVSNHLHPRNPYPTLSMNEETNLERKTIKGYAQKSEEKENEVHYEATFELPTEFGKVGAVLVENQHHKEMFIKSIVLDGFSDGPVHFTCDSWVQPKHDNPVKRVFFSDKLYLPSQTPSGLRKLREEELKLLRGNGEGERKSSDRIYDYDVYNDLGNPDSNLDLKRPVLGGSKQYPYPRRCRTGREHSDSDPSSEKRSSSFYVPRDETFSDTKQSQFRMSTISSGTSAVLESLDAILTDQNLGFRSFEDIDTIYKEGFQLPPLKGNGLTFLQKTIPRLINAANDSQNLLRFDTPETVKRDRFFWFSDEEFARETLAGANPYSIQLVKARVVINNLFNTLIKSSMLKEWPLRSKLESQIYGPPESAITREVIEPQIIGYGTIEEAIKEKKLYMLDYHDLLLPYVSKVREIKGTTLYGSRTLFFLTEQGTLKPLAIELTRPPMDGKPQWKQVFTPASHSISHSTNLWLWRLAKAHVIMNLLRTHSVMEPFVIATNRQLSAMHPINKLLHPHLRFTLAINSLAREVLINGNGIIEKSFSPNKYSMELSSVAYDQLWQFDLQALPNDLIDRGMAVVDPNAPHSLKLTIEDYPFANDGLLIWDAIKQWVTEYVNHYYPSQSIIESDHELQAWWREIRTVGHGDKAEEPWWPNLKTPKDLIHIITTIAWTASAHHAAVNFVQYTYGGYFPNRPNIVRNKMPTEDPSKEEWENFVNKPEQTLLECFPSQIQATTMMVVFNILSYHSPDEEYIGQYMNPSWAENPTIKEAFERFNRRLKEIEGIIDSRNADYNLKNRNGVGVVPYEVMKPFSGPGITGKGIPYSVSI
ncbi:Linoleate 13S-lipoxygenase 2-1, chloroplastic, partial [Mucuna pruriens]